MNCPNCGAGSHNQKLLQENTYICTVCETSWKMNENGATVLKQGQSFLAEVNPTEHIL